MHFLQVVDNTEQLPLDIHFPLGTEGKMIQSKNGPDVGKGWFTNSQTHGVYGTTSG